MSDLEDALFLMLHSKVHRRWRVEDIERLIIPPIKLQQCGFLRQDDKAVGFFTFGLFSNESSDGYKNGTRKIQPNDWQSGNNLWILLRHLDTLKKCVNTLRNTIFCTMLNLYEATAKRKLEPKERF